jgi:hypothetical protein
MGFLDKAMKAATVARHQIDEVRAAREEMGASPVDAAPLGEHEQGVLARARALGAPDPTVMLSQPEAASVLGQPLGAPSLTYTDDAIGVRYAAEDRKRRRRWSVEVNFQHGDEDGFEPALWWRDMVMEHYGDGQEVPGLGDAAVWSAPYLFVLADPIVFHVQVSTPDGDQPGAAADVARMVISRLQ